jgi:hypothetical protein
MPRSTTIDTTSYDSLLVSDSKPAVLDYFPVAANQTIKRGHALAILNNTLVLCDGTKSDGSQIIFAIAAQDITTTGGTATALVYTEGFFDSRYVLWSNVADTSMSITHRINARKVGIYFKQAI